MDQLQQRLEAIFDQALAIEDREARISFVRKECAKDTELADEIIGMLEAHEQAEGFLKTLDASGNSPTQQEIAESEVPGMTIDRYKLLQKIGEGGFGVVYMAEQEEPVRRRVALKIIKLGMDTRQVIARFEAERQALAMMDHPNIAKVFDAGSTEGGRPYFVMELVRGVALTTYCDQENLETKDRLTLFIDVCQAIQHAHLKGVIHRDIKPNNVMVTLHDGKPVPKVIDFGIAKATQQRLTEKTLFTQYQQFIGTPAYMSPEQAEMSGLDVDTRTDVYALGVMLYELLVGKTPFDSAELISAGYDEIRRRIREEEPSKPSTRVATLAQSDLTTVAKHRRCKPHTLAKALRGDLDWIVMTALEKDRQRRYESPSLLAKDVSRYLLDEAVDARPPSVAYRVRKFVSRYRVACTAGLITTGSILAGLFFSIYGLTEAKKNLSTSLTNEKRAVTEKERADREAASVQRLLYPSMLAAAIQARREGHRDRAEELLAMCPEAERGWEWHYVVARSQAKPHQTFTGHDRDQCVYDVRYEPDGRRLVSAAEDGTVRFWDPLSPIPVATFRGHDGPVLFASYLSSSNQVASIGNDQTLRILDSKTGTEIGQASGKERRFVRAALSARGSYVVTAERDGTIRLWSSNLEKELATMPARVPNISQLTVHEESGNVAAVTGNNRLHVWTARAEVLAEITEDGLGFDSITFSPSGRLLATGDQEGRVSLRQVRDGQRLDSWKAHTRTVGALAFSPDETMLVTTGWEGGISVRDISSGEELGFFLTDESHSHAVTFSPDGRHVAVAGEKGKLTEWSLDQLVPSTTFMGHNNLVFEAVATPDGRHLASVGRDGTLRIWDKRTGVEVRRLRAHGGSIYSLDINPNGDRIATRGSDGHWRLWEFPSGRLLQEHAIDHRVRNLRFSPDGTKVATGALRTGADAATQNPTIGAWDVASGQELLRLEGHRGPVMRMDFKPDGTHLVSTSHHADSQQDGRTLVWDLTSEKAILTLRPEGDAVSNSVLWSSQESRIYTGQSDGRICFWDATTGELERTVFAHGEMVGALELSGDGKRLLSSAWYSEEAKLWHAETGEFQFGLRTNIPGISDVGFCNEDQDIIAAGMDGGVKCFTIQPQALGLHAQQLRVQGLTKQTLVPMEHPATVESINSLIANYRALYQESTHGHVNTPSANQVAAAALDALAEKHYRSRHFAVALDILARAQELTHSDDRDRRIAWITEIRPVLENIAIPIEIDLSQFVGRYQEREFRLEGDQLIYRHRFFEREWPLTAIAPNKFLVRGDETLQLHFSGDSVEGHYFVGNQDLSLRSQ